MVNIKNTIIFSLAMLLMSSLTMDRTPVQVQIADAKQPVVDTVAVNVNHLPISYEYSVELGAQVYDRLPVGIANKNPGNIKATRTEWVGQIGKCSLGFVQFDTHEHGLRALTILLKNYEKKYGLRTVDGIIRRWSATDQEHYIRYVSKHLGVSPTAPLDIDKVLPQLVEAIVYFENGIQPYPKELLSLLGV